MGMQLDGLVVRGDNSFRTLTVQMFQDSDT